MPFMQVVEFVLSPCRLGDLLFSIVLALLEQGCMTLGTPLLSLEQGASMHAFLYGNQVVIIGIQNDYYRDSTVFLSISESCFWTHGPIGREIKSSHPLFEGCVG